MDEEAVDLAKAMEALEKLGAWAFRIREQMLQLDGILGQLDMGNLQMLAERHARKCKGCPACGPRRLTDILDTPTQAPVLKPTTMQVAGWMLITKGENIHIWCNKDRPVRDPDDLIPIHRDSAYNRGLKCQVCDKLLVARIDSLTVHPKPDGDQLPYRVRPITDNPQA